MEHLKQAASDFRVAQQAYHAAFRAFFDGLPALQDDRFWQLQPLLVQEVGQFRFKYGRTNGVEQAAQELFRKPLADNVAAGSQGGCGYSLHEAVGFAKAWEGFRRRLYRPLFDVVEDRSDDGYGDLLDGLPLAGRQVVDGALAGEFGNHRQFEQAVESACQTTPGLAELILQGENYLAMHLFEAGQAAFVM